MLDGSTEFREPSSEELRLLTILVQRSPGLDLPLDWAKHLRVRELGDGGMGSLRLSLSATQQDKATAGKLTAETQFEDADGVVVLASLYTDREGKLFELDVWKTDYGRLIRIPDQLE
jgi:hypothetical protein